MGNCCPPIRFHGNSTDINSKTVTLLLVGLDNSGKTTIAKRLAEEPLDGVLPTVGFSKVCLQEKGCQITIYDLGGGPQIRDIWPRYYADVHGVIFVIDASDVGRLNECRKVFEGLVLDSYISGKPVLLLANKQDIEGALDEIDVVDRLNVERLVNQQKCPTLVELCSARHFSRKMDIGIDNGYKWLLRCISKEYPSLNNRVLKDLATQEELERIKRVQREERINKIRRERDLGNDDDVKDVVEENMKSKTESSKKSYQNGIIHMTDVACIPGQIEDVTHRSSRLENSNRSFNGSNCSSISYSVSYSCEFFKYEKDHPDIMLIQNLDEKRNSKNFLVRPKSSGPNIISNRSDTGRRRGPRRKSYQRHNKTSPSPISDEIVPSGPLPKVFDPICYTEVKPFVEPIECTENVLIHDSPIANKSEDIGDSESVQVLSAAEKKKKIEVEVTSKSMPNSRKTSAETAKRRCTSSEIGERDACRNKKLLPLQINKKFSNRQLILDVTELNDYSNVKT